MSIQDLRSDLTANLASAARLSAFSTTEEVVAHLKNTLWPFLENVVGEISDQEDVLDELYHQSEDVLQPETGKLLLSVIAGAVLLADDLERRAAGDAKTLAAINEWRALAQKAATTIEEISIPEDEEDDDADGDGDDAADDADTDDDAQGQAST